MKQFSKKHILWSLGLSDEQCETVRSLTGSEYILYSWPAGEMPNLAAIGEMGMPCLICFTMDSCRQFNAMSVAHVGHLDLIPKMLLLDEGSDLATMESALDFGVTDIIRPPLTRERFAGCLRRAGEAAALHRDVQSMTREVFIERELLERKNEALTFLVDFLTSTSESFNEAGILRSAYTSLQKLFPVTTLHAALFAHNDLGDIAADLYISVPKGSPAYEEWRNLLLETSSAMFNGQRVMPTTTYLSLPGQHTEIRPTDGHLMTLPLRVSEDSMFFVTIVTPMERNLSKDQTLALDSALRHMALSIKNARNYQQMCHFADHDSLTGLYTRRHGEAALHDEVSRHQRYKQELSVLLLDLDHFKHINDTWGHLMGDEVLRRVAETVKNTLRDCDYCSRYGGEELVIVLPHTSGKNAAGLAERLRKRISKIRFTAQNKVFNVTASIGVASMTANSVTSAHSLLDEADKALYSAKNSGRNQVVTAGVEKMEAVVI